MLALRFLTRPHAGLLQPLRRRPRAPFRRHNNTSTTTVPPKPQSTPPPPPPEDQNELPWWLRGPRWRRVLGSTIIGIKFLALCHLISTKLILISLSEGPSMLPTLPTSGSVIINRLNSRGRGIKVGDLIAAHRPDDLDIMFLKRVVGMPGDYVVVDPMATGRGEETMMVRVPEGHCWIAGDNLSHSIDSRFHGPIPLGLVMGRVLAQYSGGWRWFTGDPFTRIEPGE
ncbi:IMP1 inner mitochondrial membrane peptidase-like [Orbilia ellipsospora]|uniref:IMP1 inner mitochondrial membrane peptidase-like n=1 Tax=Orbilia ellipsospora TaxID=2528407 RepID=A0AAV9X3E1_9PEZI